MTLPARALAVALLCMASAAHAADDDPDKPDARPDAPDLVSGHFYFSAGGGVWVPSSGLLPDGDIGEVPVAGAVRAQLGVGLNRYLVLNIEGGFAHGPGDNDACNECTLWSIDVGPSLVFRPTQGFALEPWVSYGAGYRHNLLALGSVTVINDAGQPVDIPLENDRVLGIDVAKLAIGADWYPTAVFGFGPYIATDIGVRLTDDVAGYAVFQAGLRLSLDPVRASTRLSPVTARAW